mgnify:CR=1 FL=1
MTVTPGTVIGQTAKGGVALGSTEPRDDLHDAALAEDIALLGDMMAAAAADAGRALTEAEVDQALGLPSQDSIADRRSSRSSRRHVTKRRVNRVRKA